MEFLSKLLKFIVDNYKKLIAALIGMLTGLIAILTIIPGNQLETFFQAIVDFLSKI